MSVIDYIMRYNGLMVRNYRIQRGLTQERLAELADVHRNTIVALERGEDTSIIPSFGINLLLGQYSASFDYQGSRAVYDNDDNIYIPVDENRMREILGRLFDYLRKAEDISRERLSDRIGIHRNTIARLETGQSNLRASSFLRLHRFFDIREISVTGRDRDIAVNGIQGIKLMDIVIKRKQCESIIVSLADDYSKSPCIRPSPLYGDMSHLLPGG
jgi:transcriptional regulator with XRE-family HTH domain